LKARTTRIWSVIHTWTSLISTVFLLLLCLTGLPLIFHHEIDDALGYSPKLDVHAPGAPKLSLDDIQRAALADHPGNVMLYMGWDKDEPGMVSTFTNKTVTSDPQTTVVKAFDAYTAKPVGLLGTGPMLVMLRLHTDMYLGLPGKWFMGVMGLVFMAAIVSGVVLYWPFTRRLNFAAIRKQKSRRVWWLDWHNLIGVVTVVWALVVGGTGVLNAYAELLLGVWQRNELTAIAAPYVGQPTPTKLASLDIVLGNAMKATPGMEPAFIAFPGTPFTSSTSDLPVYLKAVLISQPLHFGDYGGMPLKIIWAFLTVFTIVVLASGVYLYIARRRKQRRPRRVANASVAVTVSS
jgi:uncharacterized iron-regulated membrane protein